MSNDLLYERQDRIEWITLNNPTKRNCLTVDMVVDLEAHLCEMSSVDVGAVIIQSTGNTFCTGMDVNEFVNLDTPGAIHLMSVLEKLFHTIRTIPQGVVVAVQGHCMGAAMELAAAADIRVATRDAEFSMPEILIGLPSVLDAALLPQYIGLSLTKEMLLTGRPISGQRIYEAGFLNKIVEADELARTAKQFAQDIARHAPVTVERQKLLHEIWNQCSFDVAGQYSMREFALAFDTEIPAQKLETFFKRKGTIEFKD